MTRSALRRDLEGYLFLLPWLLGFLLFRAGPMLASILLSFAEWDVLKPPRWIGLENYVELVKDPLFWKSLANTAYYVGGRVPLRLLGALASRCCCSGPTSRPGLPHDLLPADDHAGRQRGAMLWAWMFDPSTGWSTPRWPRSASRGRSGWPAPSGRCRR